MPSTVSILPGTKPRRRHTVSSLLLSHSKRWFGSISRRVSARLDPGESSINNEHVENRQGNVQDPQAEMLDLFSPSLNSSTYFIDRLNDETWAHQKCSMLMSITQQSVHYLPHSPASWCFECRERRPISIQTSPSLQLESRHSSLHRWSVSSEKSDSCSLCMWREDGPLSPCLPLEDDSADIDWREFHDSLLYNNMIDGGTQR